MPEFKLNGKTYSGSTNYASAISYTEDDGSKTTVQDKISELNSNFDEQNKNIVSLGESVSNGKTLVANAITAKGVSTSTSAAFSTMAANISKITTYGFKVAPTIEWNNGKSIPCSVGDTVYVISLYAATITGATKIKEQNLMVNSSSIGGAYYAYKATRTTVKVSFGYSANWLYFIV